MGREDERLQQLPRRLKSYPVHVTGFSWVAYLYATVPCLTLSDYDDCACDVQVTLAALSCTFR